MQYIKAILSTSLAILVFSVFTYGQTGEVEVKRNVNLRPDPSTANDPIVLLRPPERLDLIEPDQTGGYYHVKDEEGDQGWVWAKNVRTLSADEIEPVAPTTSSSTIANQISTTWTKPTPTKTTFSGSEGTCTFNGNNGSDPDQFMLKNRADTPNASEYHGVTWQAVDGLPFPGKEDQQYAPMHRVEWSPAQLSIITPFEGIPVRVVGYIVAIKPQNNSSGEGTNCHFHHVGNVDTHLALVENVGDAEKTSVVIEWTPRFMKAHPNWTRTKLLGWLDSDKPVRISGFLMLDPDHIGHMGKFRNTLWEVHPITEIEVSVNGQFVDLDTLP